MPAKDESRGALLIGIAGMSLGNRTARNSAAASQTGRTRGSNRSDLCRYQHAEQYSHRGEDDWPGDSSACS